MSALVTKKADGSIQIALWNYAPPYGTGAAYTPPPADPGPSRTFQLKLEGIRSNASAKMWLLDADHGNVIKTFDAMGRPAFPSQEQIVKLRAAGQPSPPQKLLLKNGSLTVTIPPQGLVLVTIGGDQDMH